MAPNQRAAPRAPAESARPYPQTSALRPLHLCTSSVFSGRVQVPGRFLGSREFSPLSERGWPSRCILVGLGVVCGALERTQGAGGREG